MSKMIVYVTAMVLVVVGVEGVGREHVVNLGKEDLRRLYGEVKAAPDGDTSLRFEAASDGESAGNVEEGPWTTERVAVFTENPRVNVTLRTQKMSVVSVTVEFTDNATLSAPDFRVSVSYIDDAGHQRYALHPVEVSPMPGLRQHTVMLTVPVLVGGIDNLRIAAFVYSRVVSTYSYDIDPEQLEAGSNESIASGLLYELVPRYATMRIQFLARHNIQWDTYSLWVGRRPPMPRFSVTATSGDDVLFVEHVVAVKPWGASLQNVLMGVSRRRYVAPIRLTVHFYEARRSRKAEFEIPVLEEASRALRASGKVPLVETSVEGVALRLEAVRGGKRLSLVMDPMIDASDVLLQVVIGGRLVYCMETTHPKSGGRQVWADVLDGSGAEYSAVTNGSTLVSGTLYFNWRKHAQEDDEEMRQWVHMYGGDVRHVVLSNTSSLWLRSKSSRTVRVVVPAAGQATVAVIPYSVVLTSRVVMGSGAVQELANDTQRVERLEKECAELELHNCPSVVSQMLMMYYIMSGEQHAETGMSWRQLYEMIPMREELHSPLFYTEDELEKLKFEPLVRRARERMLRLYRAEYAVISSHAPWLAASSGGEEGHGGAVWTEQEYVMLRSQVTARLHNMSGELVMVPLISEVGYSAPGNAAVVFDNAQQRVRLVALRAVSAGEEMTVDVGGHAQYRVDFLLHRGVLSRSSPDSIEVECTLPSGKVFNATLTMQRRSADGLLKAVGEEYGSAKEARAAALGALRDAKAAMGKTPPDVGEVDGEPRGMMLRSVVNILHARRGEVLDRHMEWLADM